MWFLYRLVNTINGKMYIGITSRFAERMREHFSGRGSLLVARAIEKYGRQAIKHQILAVACGEAAIKLLEMDQIKRTNSLVPHGYNLTEGGEGSKGLKPGYETRRKMSDTRSRLNRGRQMSDQTKQRIGDKHRGKVMSQDSRAKMSATHRKNGSVRARPVKIEHVAYPSFKAASDATGIKYPTLVDRFRRWHKKNSFPDGYGYLT